MTSPAWFVRFAVATALVAAAGLTGCGGEPSAARPAAGTAGGIKLGFIIKQPEEPWFQLEWQFAEQAAKDLGFELLKIAGPDGEKVLTAIDNLSANGAQGFVICTPDVNLGPAIVAKARACNLKMISVDDRFLGPDGKPMENVHYLGIQARKIGALVGVSLYEEMRRRGWKAEETACMVVSFDELETARDRTEGAMEALKEAGFPADRLFKAPTPRPEIPPCIDAASTLLVQQPGVKNWLICGPNDTCVLGGVRATESRGFPAGNVIGIGINGTDCVNEFRKDKPTGFHASVLLLAREHGYKTAGMLYKWVKDGVEPPLDTRTTGTLITRDNYVKVRAEQGIKD
ncbi:MAG: arabinose ABC transporter substrate-binding protein [Kiritimatiellia bacterium]